MPMNIVIQEKRKELGLTQEQIAEYLGVSAPAVNKWEKGTTCPDISLLSPLARLLKVDLNTLLCFREDLTQQEIYHFSDKIAEAVRKDGIEAGFLLANEIIQEYPNCDSLIHTITLVLEGALVMSDMTPEQKEPYEEELLSWYERVSGSDKEGIRNGALYMLAGKYLHQKDIVKAQEIIDKLPERSTLDKRMLQADLDLMQEKTNEAAELMERVLMTAVNEVHGALIKLASIELTAGERENAHKIAEISEKAAKLFDLWGYNSLITHMDLAIAEKDKEESLRLFREMLEAVFSPWNIQDSPLYYRIYKGKAVSTLEQILPPLVANLETDSRYDFLRDNEEFQSLLTEYREKCKKIQGTVKP